jgi:hypothetical protein
MFTHQVNAAFGVCETRQVIKIAFGVIGSGAIEMILYEAIGISPETVVETD